MLCSNFVLNALIISKTTTSSSSSSSSSSSVLHLVRNLGRFPTFPLLSPIQGCYPAAPYYKRPYILISLLTSYPQLARRLHASLSPSSCIYSSLLGTQISSIRVRGPVHCSLAILITTETSFQIGAEDFSFATAMSRLVLRHVQPPFLLAPSTPY